MEETELFGALAKVRDCLYGAATALDEAIQKQSKVVLQTYDVEKIKWTKANGQKGEYEQTDDSNNQEYKALREDLSKHNGKMNIKGKFYWVFQNGVTIGRKQTNRN